MNQAYKLRLSLLESASPEARGLSEIYYCLHDDGSYPDGLTKEKKKAVHKRAAKLVTEKGKVFFVEERKGDQLK